MWLISALSGTLEIEAEIKRLKQENEKLDEIILQTRKEIEQDKERMRLDREKMRLDREKMRLENEKLDEIILLHFGNHPIQES